MKEIEHSQKVVDQYVNGVLGGKIITGKLARLAVQRHLDDLETGEARGLRFDPKAAQKVISFAHILKHYKGRGFARRKFELQPWQLFQFWVQYGWMRADGSRRFRTALQEVARKNGKTTGAAIRGLFHMILDDEPAAQCFAVATKEQQAMLAVNDAGQIATASPAVAGHIKTFSNQGMIRRVVNYENWSFFAPLGSDSSRQDGWDPAYCVLDEVHAFKDAGMIDIIESGMAARTSPMIDMITTAGHNRNGPFYSIRKVMVDILEGRLTDDSLFGVIHTLDEEDDWEDPTVWPKSNPNLHQSVNLGFLEDRFKKAKNEGGTKEVDFKVKNLNLWVDSAEVWLPHKTWMANHNPKLKPEALKGSLCYGGLDLSSTQDLTAFVLWFPEERAILAWHWIPSSRLQDSSDRVSYVRWVNEGHITATPGNMIDHSYVIKKILELGQIYEIKSIGADPFKATHQVVQELITNEVEFTFIQQNFRTLSVPTERLESMVRKLEVTHFHNPVLAWMLGNVELESDSGGNIKISKRNNKGMHRIDGVAALINSIGEWMHNEFKEETEPQVWVW